MTAPLKLGDRLLVIFDGHCGLCNRSVRWFLTRDQRDRLRFAASDSPQVAELLQRYGILERHGITAPNSAPDPTSIVVAQDAGGADERILTQSRAVLTILRELPRPWPAAAAVLAWIPRPVLDLGYRLIARHRYRIWGRLENCPIPTPEQRRHFL